MMKRKFAAGSTKVRKLTQVSVPHPRQTTSFSDGEQQVEDHEPPGELHPALGAASG